MREECRLRLFENGVLRRIFRPKRDEITREWIKLMVPCESHGTICTVHSTYAAALKTTTHPKTRCRKPYAATQHLMLLMMGVCTRNTSN